MMSDYDTRARRPNVISIMILYNTILSFGFITLLKLTRYDKHFKKNDSNWDCSKAEATNKI